MTDPRLENEEFGQERRHAAPFGRSPSSERPNCDSSDDAAGTADLFTVRVALRDLVWRIEGVRALMASDSDRGQLDEFRDLLSTDEARKALGLPAEPEPPAVIPPERAGAPGSPLRTAPDD